MKQAAKNMRARVSANFVEGLLSGVGGFLAIYIINMLTGHLTGAGHTLFLVSMGAAAMLVFAVPHSPMAQPWALVTGNLLSAALGVTVARWIPDPTFGASMAVGGSIVVMQLFRCLHPPASATALTAVIGGESITSLGYGYLLMPVLLNVLMLLVIAVVFNWPFAWRRYPAVLAEKTGPDTGGDVLLSRDAVVEALRAHDTYVDVDERDLEQIFRAAAELERKAQDTRGKRTGAG